MRSFIVLVIAAFVHSAQAAEDTIKLAFIDQLSGNFAEIGEASLHQFEYVAEQINQQGGVLGGRKFEVISYDTRGSARTAQRRLRQAFDAGARIILQGNSSHVANELTKAVSRKNEEEPGDPVLYLNFSAQDPSLTNDNCNFWHFRFESHSDMKVAALVKALANRSDIKSVYLINQDYGFGHAVSETAIRMLRQERPDIDVVANVFHPVGVVEDFKPYADQIASLNPDAIITGNWGTDIYRLVFAVDEAGLMTPFYTLNGGGAPISNVIGDRGNDRILLAHGGVYNPAPKALRDMTDDYATKYPAFRFNTPRILTTLQFLAKAIDQVGSMSTLEIATALEDMRLTTIDGDDVYLRKADHQLIGPVRISAQSSEGINLPMDEAGFGMKTAFTVDTSEISRIPTSCNITRPTGD